MSGAVLALTLLQGFPSWSVTAEGQVQWGGDLYRPVGARVEGNVPAIQAAIQAGVRDLLVELPSDRRAWPPVLDALRQEDARFLVSVESLAPLALGFAVEPEAYRLSGATGTVRVQGVIAGAREALLVVAGRGGDVVSHRMLTLGADGRLDEMVETTAQPDNVVLVYPLLRQGSMPDAWEEFDRHRDGLVAAMTRGPVPTGLRGVLNPGGVLARYPTADEYFVPTCARFRSELEVHLRSKYGSLKRAEQAWGLTASDLKSLRDLSRMVPLWSARRGVSRFWDPVAGRLYGAETRGSAAWTDIQAVLQGALRRRGQNLALAVQRTWGVPVIQRWIGWNGPYEAGSAGLTGLAARVEGDTFTDLVEGMSRAASTLSRWPRPGWLVVDDLRVPENEDRARALNLALVESASLGVGAWFVRPTSAADLTWIASARPPAPERVRVLPFPESAQDPAIAMRMPSGVWWVPSPSGGNRLDFGGGYFGYRISSIVGETTVLWGPSPARNIRLRVVNPKDLTVSAVSGLPPEVKVLRNAIEVSVGDSPILIRGAEIPVPEPALDATLAEYAAMVDAIPAEARSIFEDIPLFREAANAFNSNPSGAFFVMRSRLERLRRSISPHVWIEAESVRESTFSDVVEVPGASGGRALSLVTRLTPPEGFFRARFSVTPRYEGRQEVWVAVRGTREAWRGLRAVVADQELRTDAPALSLYGGGFGWLRLGEANLAPRPQVLEVRASSPLPSPLWLDAVLLAPPGYRPAGPRLNWMPTPRARR